MTDFESVAPQPFTEENLVLDSRFAADTQDMSTTLRLYLAEGLEQAQAGQFDDSDASFKRAERYLTADPVQHAKFFLERAGVHHLRGSAVLVINDLQTAMELLKDSFDTELKEYIAAFLSVETEILAQNQKSWIMPVYSEYIRIEGISQTLPQ